MTKTLKFVVALLLAIPLFAQAQQRSFSQPELDQMLAPVALYPDPLLSQVLMAATYPDEVAEAARWSRANPGLQGDAAVRAVEFHDWDPSVKSLVAFPQILQRMGENPGWTQSLGDAFLAQEPHVMDTVQQLRYRAQAAGNLRSDDQVRIEQQGPTIVVQQASPQYVYVPYYDPYVVYGPWWWPAYQPVVWSPWPRPVRVYVSLGFFFGAFDWHHRHARVVHPNAYYYRSARFANRTLVATPQRWQADPQRRAAFVQRQAVQGRQPVQVQRQESRAATVVERQERRVDQRVDQRVEQRAERREGRQAARIQAQPAVIAPVQPVQPAAAAARVAPQPIVQPGVERRVEQRVERREERREERAAARVQAQPAAPAQVQAPAPVQPRIQPAAQPRVEQRQERREERREMRQAQPQPQPQPQLRAPAAVVQPQPQQRMPAAVAPQTPRTERQAERQERREQRQEQRGQKG